MVADSVKITASLVLYKNNHADISRVISSIKNSNLVNTLYVIDNSPTALESDLFKLPWVHYIHASKNLGYGAGHNIALRLALESSQFHFVINPDIIFDKSQLRLMINRINQDQSIGLLMPKVIYPNGDLQYLCKLIPTPFDLIIRRFMVGPLKNVFIKSAERFELRFTGYNKEMDVPYLSGCFMLFRVEALCKIGIFDERFFMYPEDIDISRRMHRYYRTLFFPGAVVTHDHVRDSYKSIKMLWIHAYNLFKYFNKWGWILDGERSKVNTKVLKKLGNHGDY